MTVIDAAEVVGDAPLALYRLYAADGTLLYVGITHSLSARFAEHALEKPWWPEVARKTVAWCNSRTDALRAEAQAIKDEDPVHNIVRPLRERIGGADRHKPEDTPVTLRPPQDVRAWLLAESARRGISRSALIIEAVEEKRAREKS